MSLRTSALRASRPATHALRRRAPFAARSYVTGQQPSGTSLVKLAAGGVAGGFTAALLYNYFNTSATAYADGAAVPEMPDTSGMEWQPIHALEMDDPKVCAGYRHVGVLRHVYGATAHQETEDDSEAYRDLGVGLLLGFGLLLQPHAHSHGHTLESIEASAPPDGEHAPATFLRDHWIRPTGGEGSSCVLAGGRVFEKAGVNVSVVEGRMPRGGQEQMRADHSSIVPSDTPLPYFATGLSIVIHPRSPHVPTVHLNYRYFELCDADSLEPVAWWFGGGSDLTPNYLYPEDAELFHDTLKAACDKHGPAYYPAYKKWCDKYFYLPHRQETRGVGGIFFDDLTSSSEIHGDKSPSREEIFDFVKSCSSAFLPAYVPIVQRRKGKAWTEHERRWQLLRRGRYVEFNLLYDRGTKFGLNIPGARVESILMSLPENARWEYCTPVGTEEGSPEKALQDILKTPCEWATTK
ncbi:uncharacterized protein CcaverHIS019_0111020 [Cutaneotrichosporon cavernicola]|uniref:coproporphyrinogen oxidase n=1 Tax=Cutaneotrichosporon cavernicola TaxID=279322 RepID=A0AA48KXK7_9TREE|nr:uncharacterized protein CcaverHIS019_0111020 [Cutaneotrichosporon cavernicola]BEI88384.1 hypothetical protein CcaverHIS019_0111020 [Cutaneotrichosporon cavernicola]BEI96157.1 hypothetical protein CcaverHIS631_0111060 [Cutaneotrichosporon cavernicola]BEJ03929.1 hypothetical protein CcaverHIS641_0111040 [Cutaneotrichosporon cavernicola]